MTSLDGSSALRVTGALPDSVVRRMFWRIIPVLFFIYILNYLDRANVGIAALKMNEDLGFSPSTYGTGAAIFFIGYLLAGIPANLIVLKVGARRSLAAMMMAWGATAAATSAVRDVSSFFLVRILLGVAEAGFVPAMMLYLSYWFPQRERGRAVGSVSTATVISLIIGGPLSGALLELPNWLGLASWQWLFIIEGLPTVLFGLIVLRYLPDRPQDATWLNAQQVRELTDALAREQNQSAGPMLSGAWEAVRNWRVWALFCFYICVAVGFLGMVFWMPLIIRRLEDLRPFEIGIISAVPFLFSAFAMVVGGWHSDRSGKRFPYLILGPLIGAAGFAASGLLTFEPVLSIAALIAAMAFFNIIIGPFWSLTTSFLRGRAAAVGIATVSAAGSIGGFLGTRFLGQLREQSGNFQSGLYVVASFLLAAALIMSLTAYFSQQTGQARSNQS